MLVLGRNDAVGLGKQINDGLLQRRRAAGKAIQERVSRQANSALAAVGIATVVFTVRHIFACRQVLGEARRHVLETLCDRAFHASSPQGSSQVAASACH
jgi:hypothetical protein